MIKNIKFCFAFHATLLFFTAFATGEGQNICLEKWHVSEGEFVNFVWNRGLCRPAFEAVVSVLFLFCGSFGRMNEGRPVLVMNRCPCHV